MKAEELRIGNYHESNSIDIPREGIRSIRINGKAFSSISGYGIYLIEEGKLEVSPILLTEEWLIKFGFEFDGSYWKPKGCWHRYVFHPQTHLLASLTLEPEGGIVPHAQVYYVHQLQNLYFALTGKELTIKKLP